MNVSRALAVLFAGALTGCASIHSYDAAREINPVRTVSLSGSVGATFDERDRNGDGKVDGIRQERVLVPDARLNVLVPVNDALALAFDPLPPAVGGGIVAQIKPEEEGVPRITLAPTIGFLVYPQQPHNVYSIDVPLALSWKISPHLVLYTGPKYIYQNHTLQPVSGTLPRLLFSHTPDRPDHPLELQGVFAGFAFGWLHLQISPEVIWYESRRHDGEHVFQVGSQVRLSL